MNAASRFSLRLAAALLAPALAAAAEGDLDTTFGTDATAPGFGFYLTEYMATGQDSGRHVVATNDGKLYEIGFINGGGGRNVVQRTDANGYPDYSYGNAGMRSYIRPCNNGIVSDAQVDAQNRLWLTPFGCTKFLVYRLTPNGDLDTTLQGDGTVDLSFDRGTHYDVAEKLLLLPDGGFIVAGTSAGDTRDDLGIAVFDSSGAPAAGFGTGGKVIVQFPYDVYRISGLHRMSDGRLVIDGLLIEDDHFESFVVRLQPDGQRDAAFGISNPGISRYDFRPANHLDGSVSPVASWLESDGKLVQAGTSAYTAFPNSRYDVTITRWKADGSLDTSVGVAGTKRYPLDLSGNTPADADDNKELATSLVREGNGRWLIAYNAYKAGPGTCFGVLRLKRNFSVDTSFGTNGRTCANLQLGSSEYTFYPSDLIARPGRAVIAGTAYLGQGGTLAMASVEDDLLFGDTFE